MENPLSTERLKQEHFESCGKPWNECNCIMANILFQRISSDAIAEDRAKREAERSATATGERPQLSNASIPEDLERKRRVHLNNVGINLIRKRLLDLDDDAILERIHLLDRATRDASFLEIKKTKQGIQGAINNLKAILQGVIIQENTAISALADEAERRLRERDAMYVVKEKPASAPREKKSSTGKKGLDAFLEKQGTSKASFLDELKNL